MTTEAITPFKNSLRGKLILPEDPAYHTARKVYNGMIDKCPAMIVQCADVADVITSVNFARDRGLLLAVRGGGHNGGGLGVCDGGLVIDLSLMKSIHIDPLARTVRVEGGCTLADIDHATHAFGMAVPTGIFSSTGIGGLALGGGLGHLTRPHGLTIDNLLEADVVLADGSYVKASPYHNSDLFWALRGGGGNFGVVVSFLFQTHPISIVYGGPMLWDIQDAKELMQWYRELTITAPETINGFFALMTVPPGPPFPEDLRGKKVCGIIWCCTGTKQETEDILSSVRRFKTPALDWTSPLPFPVLQSLFDAALPPGLQQYWKGDYVHELTDEAIDLHLQYARQAPTWQSLMHLYPINGAASRIAPDDTAWNYRNAAWATVIVGVSEDPAGAGEITHWAKNYAKALHPHCSGGSYVNFMMNEDEDRIKSAYGVNYDRLVRVKTKYDPKNLFCINQNIKPLAPSPVTLF